MMLWQEKWVTYLEGAHSFAIIYTPWALDIFCGLVFLICFYTLKKLHTKAVLTFSVVSLFYADFCAISSAFLVDWMEVFAKKYVCTCNVKH